MNKDWIKSIGVPMEIAFSILAFSLIGYYLGKHLGGKTGAVVGISLGAIIGFFAAIKYLSSLFES